MARAKQTTAALDDTVPLMCIFEGISKKEHVDYIIKVQRGASPEGSWQVVHRYSDFAALHAALEVSGIEMPLPPKKVFGNMDTTFVVERQQGLQNFMNFILGNPLLARHISVKKFLDPVNYSENFQENATQHVAMFLRSVPNWEIVEPLPDIGWRIHKSYFLIKPTDASKKDIRNMLTWTCKGPDFGFEEKDFEAVLKLLTTIQHPYIYPTGFTSCSAQGAIIVRNFIPNGTLRDIICKAKPKTAQLKKYGSPKSRVVMPINQIQIFGKQILEALKFLHDKGFPYGHLHTGNIVLEGNVCRILDLENSLLGVSPIHRHRYVPHKKIQDKESEDVYCFAHVLYEMAFGEPLRTSVIHEVPPTSSPDLKSILESILTEEVVNKSGLPSVEDLLNLPFFSSVSLPPTDKPQFKIPSKLKECIRNVKEKAEQRLKEDQKYLRQFRRASKAHAHHMCEEEKKKRKKSAKKPPAAPPPPVAAPPPPVSPPPPAAAPPKTEGRGALLSSISGFSKTGLKKAMTNDRSAPKV
ncbi:predicted protein [Nematostella vectensis]|uniref:PX domain-containing protein kinase-like protein n=1 Tax=Nematostella vectensis TaxID=45351 RepID=A7RJF7_NEMVE|nr:predicted protein [Nematostella vectensis]|eukprot:XP_001640318.1 predicted protein [Nematostella vectensis]